MKVYQCHTRFLATGLNRYIPVNGVIYMYENSAKLAIQDSCTSDDEWFNIEKCDVEYNTLPEVNWFSQNVIDTFFTLVKTISEDEAGGAPISAESGTVVGDIVTTPSVFSFTASDTIDFTIPIKSVVNLLLGARLYISDPKGASAISKDFTLTFYPDSSQKASTLFIGTSGKSKLVWSETSIATVVGTKDWNADDVSNMNVDDTILFMGDFNAGSSGQGLANEFHVIDDITGTPRKTVDNIGIVYPINTGLALVEQFKDMNISTAGGFLYGRLKLASTDTFDVKFEGKVASV